MRMPNPIAIGMIQKFNHYDNELYFRGQEQQPTLWY
jgi:hypothetical protein